jgi:integrase
LHRDGDSELLDAGRRVIAIDRVPERLWRARALFQAACRFDELIQLRWGDYQRVGEEIVA